jgi:uncharacterized protein YbjT (DUF2867 family)
MVSGRVVVTGANSYIGQKFIADAIAGGYADLQPVITPWADESGLIQAEGLTYLRADLTGELPADVAEAIRDAGAVVHLAWIRGADEQKILASNVAMLENILSHMSDPARLIFISSVSASPETLSVYGKTKYVTAGKVLAAGGVVVVTGLIVDDVPMGPYKLLADVVRKFPLSLRFTPGSVKVYPIRTQDFLAGIRELLTTPVPTGSYRLFPADAVDINAFMGRLEQRYPRGRIKVPVSYSLAMAGLKGLRATRLFPPSLMEKLLTFLYKDEAFLSSHKKIAGTEALERPVEELI